MPDREYILVTRTISLYRVRKGEAMRNAAKPLFPILLLACIVAGLSEISVVQSAEQYKKVLVKFPAFSLGAGEKIVGVNMTVYSGEIVHLIVPRGWSCQKSGMPVTQHVLHCFSANPAYAITMTGRLPVISIYDMSDITKKTFSLETAVEMEDSSGKGFTKQLGESELIIQ